MKAIREFAQRLPWWLRYPSAVVVLLLVFKLRASILISDFTDVLSEFGDVEYDSSYFDWRGRIGARNLVFAKYDDEGRVLGEFAMDRMELVPPWWWLARNALFRGGARYLPDDFGIRLENFRNTADTPSTPGNYTNLPYDAKGCVPLLLTQHDITEMGVPPPRRNVVVKLQRTSDHDADATFSLESPGFGRMTLVGRIDVEWPIRTRELAEVLEEAPLRSVTMRFEDLGFIEVRNRSCAKQHGMTAAMFRTYHMQEVRRRMREERIDFGETALQQYARFAENGGELVIRTNGQRKISLMEFLALPWLQEMQAFPLQISANGAAPVTMLVARTGPVGTPGAEQPPVAAAPAASPVLPASRHDNAPRPAPESSVPYEAAAHLVGEHITVRTRYGGDRSGRLLVYSPGILTVRLDHAGGGFTLTIFRQDVEDIRYTPEPAAVVAAGSP